VPGIVDRVDLLIATSAINGGSGVAIVLILGARCIVVLSRRGSEARLCSGAY